MKKIIEMVNGIYLNSDKNIKETICESCLTGKWCTVWRLPFSGKTPLEMIHTDSCGPITPSTWDNYKYFISYYLFFFFWWLHPSKSKVIVGREVVFDGNDQPNARKIWINSLENHLKQIDIKGDTAITDKSKQLYWRKKCLWWIKWYK